MWLWRATSKSPNIPVSAWNKHADLLERSLTGVGTTNDPQGLSVSPQHQSGKLFGVTVSVDGYYPAADENPDTYWVRFSSAIFTGIPPVGALDEMDSETPPISAHVSPASTNAPYLTEGTKVLVMSINGCWWIVSEGGGGETPWISFAPTQTFSTSDAAFSATVKSVHGNVPDAVDDVVTINNGDGVQDPPFSGDTSSIGICANYDPDTDAYYCINLGCPP